MASTIATTTPATVTKLIPEATFILGRAIERFGDVLTTTQETSALDVDMQQVVEASGSLMSLEGVSYWTPASLTTLAHALIASFSVILVSELGDKTFIITAIMAMKNSRILVLLSSSMALLLMTVLSVGMGVAVTVIPKLYTHYSSIVLFLCFGLKMLKEAYDMSEEEESSEFDEVKKSLEKEENPIDAEKTEGISESDAADATKIQVNKSNDMSSLTRTIYVAPVVIKVFTMIFVAEWGDRSQISTIILAAREDVVGVFLGSFAGHVLCTGLAVIGGRFVADMISVKTRT